MSQAGSAGAVLTEPLSEEQIEQLPVYEWEDAQLGDAAPPFVYEVTEQSIADYCAAVRNTNPLYLDAAVAAAGPFGGLVAPPTFAFKCAPLRRNEVMHARGFASPEEKGVRATPYAKAELHFVRPIRPSDVITSVVRLQDKYERRGSQFITWHTRAVDAHDQLVVEYTYTIIWRQAPRQTEAPSAPAAPAAPGPVGEPLPSITREESQAAIDRYAELTRVRPRRGHSLHSDAGFAQRTIFGGTVNMGVATAAYCSEVVERAFGPAALLRPGARLEFKGTRPVRAGDTITISGHITGRGPDGVDCALDVHNQTATLVGVATARVLP